MNPSEEEILRKRAYDTVDEIPEQVDVMDVFLPPEKTPETAEDRVQAGLRRCGCKKTSKLRRHARWPRKEDLLTWKIAA